MVVMLVKVTIHLHLTQVALIKNRNSKDHLMFRVGLVVVKHNNLTMLDSLMKI